MTKIPSACQAKASCAFRSFLQTQFSRAQALWQNAWKILCRRASPWYFLVLVPFFLMIPFDDLTLQLWRFPNDTSAHHLAKLISLRGDFYNGCAALMVVFFAVGFFLKKPRLQLLAFAMLYATLCAGVLSLGIRVLSGRPRPAEKAPDGLYGPRFKTGKNSFVFFDYGYQSFPSGHATTAFATALPILIVAPPVGIPVLGAAVAVSWARFQLNRHRLSDLYAGMLFGTLFGAAFGLAVKKTLPPPRS